MSRSPHPLLDRLYRGAATPAQLLGGARAVQGLLESVVGDLRRVGFDVSDPWAGLLEVPLAARSGGLQAALDQLAQADVPAEAAAVTARRRRESSTGAGEPKARAPADGAAPDGTGRLSRPPDSAPTPAARPQSSAAAATPRAAAAAWQRRAAAAGVEDAFFSALHERPPAAGPGPSPLGALPPALARTSARPSPAGDAAAAAYAATTLLPLAALPVAVLPRLSDALDRIDRRTAATPAERFRPTAPEPASAAETRAAAAAEWPPRRYLDADAPAAAARQAWAQRHAVAQTSNAVDASTRGFRGLAARAAAATAGSLPSLPAAAVESAGRPAPDDEQLVERLAHLLRREAERDGIDTSDITP